MNSSEDASSVMLEGRSVAVSDDIPRPSAASSSSSSAPLSRSPPLSEDLLIQHIGEPPLYPEADACCGEGCRRCVYDVYEDRLANYELKKKNFLQHYYLPRHQRPVIFFKAEQLNDDEAAPGGDPYRALFVGNNEKNKGEEEQGRGEEKDVPLVKKAKIEKGFHVTFIPTLSFEYVCPALDTWVWPDATRQYAGLVITSATAVDALLHAASSSASSAAFPGTSVSSPSATATAAPSASSATSATPTSASSFMTITTTSSSSSSPSPSYPSSSTLFRLPVYVVGPHTAQACTNAGFTNVVSYPKAFTGHLLGEALAAAHINSQQGAAASTDDDNNGNAQPRRKPYLFLCGDLAKGDVLHPLEHAGIPCEKRIVYTTVKNPHLATQLQDEMNRLVAESPEIASTVPPPPLPLLVFFSPSGVEAVFDAASGLDWLHQAVKIAIGPTTAARFCGSKSPNHAAAPAVTHTEHHPCIPWIVSGVSSAPTPAALFQCVQTTVDRLEGR